MDFDPKGTISEVRVHVGLYLDVLDADRSPNAAVQYLDVLDADRSPNAADSPRSSAYRLITMAKLKKKP